MAIELPGLKARQFFVRDGKDGYVEPDGEFHSFRYKQVGKVVDTLKREDSSTEAILCVRLDVNGDISCYVGGNFRYASIIGALEIMKDHLMSKSKEG